MAGLCKKPSASCQLNLTTYVLATSPSSCVSLSWLIIIFPEAISLKMETRAPNRIRMVLFDFDGTLTKPGALDFDRIKAAIGCPNEIPVLENMGSITDPIRRREVSRLLDEFEMEGAEISEPNPGAEAVIPYLKERGILIGILTQNTL